MAYTLRYYKTFPQPGERDILLEIYEKDGVRPSQEIGPVVQALHLDIQGAQDDIDTPIVKTSLTMAFVDAPDHEESATKKCGNWEEFYTPDSTYWQVILKARDSQGLFRQIWGGYVTPDSFSEQLRYRGSVTIVARDNIGHLQDFPFDAKGNEDGMITIYDLVNTAWSKIESPMRIDWRGVADSALWLHCEGTEAPASYVNASAFEGKSWLEAVENVLYSMGMVMRYVGNNTVQVSSLRYMPYMGEESISDLNIIEPIFVSSANRELAPAVKRIEESVSYNLEKGVQIPLADGVDFSGAENTAPFYSANIFGETVITNIPVHPIINANGDGWSNIPSSTLFFDPRRYTIREDRLKEDIKRMLYLACNTDGSRSVGYRKTVVCRDFRISVNFGRVIQKRGNEVLSCYGFASGFENNGIGAIRVRKVSCYISVEQDGETYFYTGSGWQAEPFKIELEAQETGFGIDIGFRGMTGVAEVSFFIENIDLDAMRDYSDGEGLYVPISSMHWGLLDNQSVCATNSVNTNYLEANNVIISRSPEIAPALDDVPFPVIIKNGIFVKSGNAYLPARLWAWYGGTPQQMAVYNHLQMLCYYAKPNNVITGDIVNADLGDMRALYLWHGKEHLMQGGSLNFLNGRIEGAILREFTRYESLWGDVTGDAGLPDVESGRTTNTQDGSSASQSGYENNTEVYIGGEGGSITVDNFMSDTSENPVQNKVIKAYVDDKAAEAQAAAEQYIQDEVLTYYATTKYVEEREEYLVSYAEELVNDLEKEIDGRGYLTSAAMGNYATKDEIKNFVTKGGTLDHYGITDAVYVGGRETKGSANDIETPSIVGYTNGMTDTPFTYGNILTIASNPTYYVAQLAIRANGIFAYRARNDSKVWTDWKTVVDSSNIGDFALPKTGGTITGNLTVNGFIYGSVPSGSDLPGYAIVKNGNSLIIQATQGNVNNKDGNIILGGYGVPAQVIKLESILTYLTGDLTVIGGITLGNKKIFSWDEITGSGGDGNYLPLTGGTIDGSLTINGGFKVQSVHGHYINFDGFSLTANAGLKVASGYSLSLAGEGITAWEGLKTKLGLGSLAYKDEADVVMAGASYSTGSDLNDVKTAGIYTVYGGVTNAAESGSMITLASANPYYIGQITVKYNGEMYSRSFVPENGGVWSGWRTVIDSVNVGDFTLPKTGGVITGALTVSANFQANANILIVSGSIKFLNQGNIEGVGAIIHKIAGAYNMDQYGNFYAASDATDGTYWNFKRADGTASLYVYGGSGKVETAFDTNLGRYGGSTGCTVNMGNAYNRANTNVYGDFKVIGYPAEFQNGITLGDKTITSWDSLKSGWWNQRLQHATDVPIAIDHLSYINIARTLNSNDNITIEIRNSYSFYMATLIFEIGSTIPNFTLIETSGRNLIWENGINVFNNLEPNTIYKIDIDYMYAAVTTYNR